MSIARSGLSSNKGFTLVELLIVVAIIGVLAATGVPSYRRMVQKSRKGEAQVMLGNIATAEGAFFSEYGAYGNNIARMGANMDGKNFIYTAGVSMTSGCGNINSADGFSPTAAQIPALANNLDYQKPVDVNGVKFGNRIGNMDLTTCLAGNALAEPFKVYQATATGYIRGGTKTAMNNCDGSIDNCDQWRVDESRNIVNAVDGIN